MRLQGGGTTVVTSGTTAPPRGTTVGAYGTTVDPGAVLPQPQQQPVKGGRKNGGSSKEEGGDKRRHVRDDSTKTFPTRTPLNSTAFLRLKSTKKKRRKDVVFVSLRGAPNRLVPSKGVSGKLMAHD